jgi:hypothetical protein
MFRWLRASSTPRVRSVANLLLTLFVVGMVAHVAHHFLDPDCDDSSKPFAHPCVSCAAFHGGVETPDDAVVPVPVWTASAPENPTHLAAAPKAAERLDAAPRAPPAA